MVGKTASNLGEQVHQIRDRLGIELLHSLDESRSETLIRESFAEPVELFDSPVPPHGLRQASLVAELLLHQDPLVFGANGDAGTELLGIASRELLVGMDLDPREQRLRIRRLNARRFHSAGPDVIVEQRHRDEVFEIVLGLLFGLWMVLRTKGSTPRDVEAGLEDVAAHMVNTCRRQTVATLQIQHRLQHRLAMND